MSMSFLTLRLKILVCPVLFCLQVLGQKDSIKTRQILVFPVIAKSIETSWSLGAAGSSTFHLSKSDTTTRTSNLQSILLYSLEKQFIAALNGTIYFHHEEYILQEQLSYSYFPDKFWGMGKNSSPDSVEDYSFRQYYIYLHLMRNLGKKMFAGVLFEFQNVMDVNYQKGGIFDIQQVAGRYPYKISGLGLSFTYDNRNDAFAPNKGNFAQFYFNHFDPILGSDFNYTNFVIDLRKFFRIYKQQVLAVQAYGFWNVGGDIPLRSLATLGGNTSMRGYYDGRFRDKEQVVFQAEYRIPLFKRWGAVAFFDGGDVGHTAFDFSLHELKYSCGGGLRYALNKSEKLNLRLDYGVGQGGNSGMYLQLGEAF